jgi:hypothetical protein
MSKKTEADIPNKDLRAQIQMKRFKFTEEEIDYVIKELQRLKQYLIDIQVFH